MITKKTDDKTKALKTQLRATLKYNQSLILTQQKSDQLIIELNNDLNKLKEIFKAEEQSYINRISNQECSLEDSFEDNQRLQTVISTLGGRINNLEKTNRSNIKRFKRNYSNELNHAQMESPAYSYHGTNFKYDPDASKISN